MMQQLHGMQYIYWICGCCIVINGWLEGENSRLRIRYHADPIAADGIFASTVFQIILLAEKVNDAS